MLERRRLEPIAAGTCGLLVAIAASTFALAGDAPVDWTAVRERVRPCVVTVEVLDADEKRTDQGTGFFVTKDGVVATSRHLFRRAASARVVRSDGTVHAVAGIRAVDMRNDLVLLAVTVDPAPLLPWGETKALAPGSPVAMLGSPKKDVAGTFSTGTYVGRKDAMGVVGFVETTAPMEHGGSGCPLFDSNGRLLGLGAARVDWDRPSGLAVPVERVKALVDSLAVSKEVRPFGTAATFLDASEWEVQRSKPMAVATESAGRGDGAGLVKAMDAVVKAFPKSALALYGLAGAQSQHGEHAGAATSLRAAVALWPGYLEAWADLGDALERTGRHAEAAAAFHKAIAIEPRDLTMSFRYGAALVGAGDHAGAIRALEPVTVRVPDRPDGWAWLGLAYVGAGRLDDADRVVERLRPDHPDVADRLAGEVAKRRR